MEEGPPQDPIEQYYEIQEIKEIPRRIESSATGSSSESVVKNAAPSYLCNLLSNSTSTGRGRGETLDDEMEVILLLQKEEPARRRQVDTTTDRRVIELSDDNCKLALRRHLEMTKIVEQTDATSSRGNENVEMLRKLPEDTIVTRQEKAKSNKVEDSDYKELTETSSSGASSSTSGCAAIKMKRIPRAVRNKT